MEPRDDPSEPAPSEEPKGPGPDDSAPRPLPPAGAGVPGEPRSPLARPEAAPPAAAGTPTPPGAPSVASPEPALTGAGDAAPARDQPDAPAPAALTLPTGPRALPPAALTHMRIRAFLRVLITGGLATAAGIGLAVGFPESSLPIGLRFALPFVLPLLLFVHALIMPKQRWKRARWSVDATTIVWRHGVIFQVENTVPRSRVQHIEVTQGPLQRKFGLAALVIYTAGERLHAVTIAGMHAEEARALRSTLLERVRGHVV